MSGKIYKLEGGGKYYFGSTTQEYLCNRKAQHKQDAKKYSERPMYKYFNDLGWDNVNIIFLKEVEKEKMKEMEKEYILLAKNDDKCFNIRSPLMTLDEKKTNQ